MGLVLLLVRVLVSLEFGAVLGIVLVGLLENKEEEKKEEVVVVVGMIAEMEMEIGHSAERLFEDDAVAAAAGVDAETQIETETETEVSVVSMLYLLVGRRSRVRDPALKAPKNDMADLADFPTRRNQRSRDREECTAELDDGVWVLMAPVGERSVGGIYPRKLRRTTTTRDDVSCW